MLRTVQVVSKQAEVRIEKVEYDIETIGNNAKVKVTHQIKNNSNEDCNVSVTLSLDDESAVIGYSFKNEHGEFVSQLKEKEQAKIEQREARANGYSTGMMEQKTENTLSISLQLVMKGREVSFIGESVK